MKSLFERTTGLWLSIALVTVLLLQGDKLLSAWHVNLGNRLLLPEWQVVSEEIEAPHCEKRLDESAAAPWVEKSLALAPQNERAWLKAGRVYWLLGKCEQARAAWRHAVDLAPTDAIAELELTNALYASNTEASLVSQVGDSGIATYSYNRGLWASEAGLFDAAIDWYELSMAIEPSLVAVEELAGLYVALGQHDGVRAAWQRLATSTLETVPDHWWALGQVAMLDEDWSLAVNAFQQGAEITDDPYRFYMVVATIYGREQDDFSSARYYYELAMQVSPEVIWTYIAIGGLELEQENYEAALVWYRRAHEVRPDKAHGLYYQGIALRKQGKIAQAQEMFQKVVAIKPKYYTAWYYLGLCAYAMGDLAQAITYFERAVALYPGPAHPQGYVRQLGDWYVEAGRCQEAIAAYEQVLAWQPDDKTTQERLDAAKELCQ